MGVSRKQITPNFSKNKHFLTPDTHTQVCVSGGKKCSVFGKFGLLWFLETPVFRFAFLPYYRRVRKIRRTKIELRVKAKHWQWIYMTSELFTGTEVRDQLKRLVITYQTLILRAQRVLSEAYSEPCQTSKMEHFVKNSQQLKGVNYFCKSLHLKCLTRF